MRSYGIGRLKINTIYIGGQLGNICKNANSASAISLLVIYLMQTALYDIRIHVYWCSLQWKKKVGNNPIVYWLITF